MMQEIRLRTEKARRFYAEKEEGKQKDRETMEKLKELDEVAHTRFASVYLPLDDLNGMKREVDRLLEQE